MKIIFVFILSCTAFVSEAQFQTITTTPAGWQDHYLFHTDNPFGSGVVSWGFHLNSDTIYCQRFYGKDNWGETRKILTATRHMAEYDSLEKYVWITKEDSCYQITYDRKQKEIVNLKIYRLSEDGFKKFDISNIVHFW